MDVLFGKCGGVSSLRRAAPARLAMAALLVIGLAGPAFAAPQDKKQLTAEAAADKSDKVICKRFAETGSLVKSTRVCHTKREWDRERDTIRASVQGSGACNTGGGGACF
jgi:CHASE1-domain containing sensor protein